MRGYNHDAATRQGILTANGLPDDGKGFDFDALDGKEGLGLASMRERLRLVEGDFVIDSLPAGGTRIEARVPLPRESPRLSLHNGVMPVG